MFQNLRRYFVRWKLIVNTGMPMNQNPNKEVLYSVVNRENKYHILKKRMHGTKFSATPFDILMKVDNLRSILDKTFKSSKRLFIRKAKILYIV